MSSADSASEVGPHVLLIEDNPGDALLVRLMLEKAWPAGFELDHVQTLAEGLARLGVSDPTCVILDMSLPDADGLHGLHQVLTRSAAVPVVVYTGRDDEQLAVRAVAEGAQDYLVKGAIEAASLRRSLLYAMERARVQGPQPAAEVAGRQPSARQILEMMRNHRVSRSGDRYS
jgi:sigma-B regulation protein RsbU (phosphoserine phosphatase)